MENKINNNLMVFDEREVLGKEFRIYGTKENPLFLAKDVAEWIDYSYTSSRKTARDTSKMLKTIDEDEKLVGTLFLSGQNREAWFLTEDGLYEVLMQSRKPIAKAFKKEVKKILKQIRTTGGYIPVKEEDTEMEILSKALLIANKTMEMQKERLKNLEEEKNKAIEDKNKLIHTSKTYTASELAKELGFRSAKALNEALRDMNIIYKCNGTWLPKANYVDKGYMETKQKELDNGIIKYYSKWTGTGRDFLLDLFKDE